jgi:hypothetical protein
MFGRGDLIHGRAVLMREQAARAKYHRAGNLIVSSISLSLLAKRCRPCALFVTMCRQSSASRICGKTSGRSASVTGFDVMKRQALPP